MSTSQQHSVHTAAHSGVRRRAAWAAAFALLVAGLVLPVAAPPAHAHPRTLPYHPCWLELVEEREVAPNAEWEAPPPPAAPEFVPPAAPQGFWARYPDVAAGITTSLGGAGLQWATPEGAAVWERMVTSLADLPADVSDMLMAVNIDGAAIPVAVGTSSEPAYVFSTLPPDVVRAGGLYGSRVGFLNAVQRNDIAVDILEAASPATSTSTMFVTATRDPRVLALPLGEQFQLASWYRYRVDRTLGGGIDVHATLANPLLPDAVQEAAWHNVVTSRADLLYPMIDANRITHVQEVQFMGGQFQVVSTEAFPGFEDVQLTERELAGHPVASTDDLGGYAVFDWFDPSNDRVDFTITEAGVPTDPPAGSFIVYTKYGPGWRVFGGNTGLTEDELRHAGFLPGTFGGSGPEVWIPAPGPNYGVDTWGSGFQYRYH